MSNSFQSRVVDWVIACFGEQVMRNKAERMHRFTEEALELVQAGGLSRDDAHKLVDYVYNRPIGEFPQEVGGTMITLHALVSAFNYNVNECAEEELQRCWIKKDAIRTKQKNKPPSGPLPMHVQIERAQEEAADLAGIGRGPFYSDPESGKSLPAFDREKAAADILNEAFREPSR
jgi:hypothetical protein